MELRELLLGREHIEIDGDVDPYLEASKISRRDQRVPWIAPAKGYNGFRLSGNLLSTRLALASALGCDVPSISTRVLAAVSDPQPAPRTDRPENYLEVRVQDLPIPTYFAGDGGPYVSSGIFHAGWDGAFNVSFHRMMHMGGTRFAVRVVPRHLMSMLRSARAEGQDLEAVVSIGSDPMALLGGSISLPYGSDEMEVASTLHRMAQGEPLKLFSPVDDHDGPGSPVGTEVVLHGHFIDETAPEGPFVDITSTYDRSGMEPGEPVFEVDRVLVREEPIMHVLLPGGLEHYLMMGIPKEPAIERSVKQVVPKVHGVRLTEGGCCWLHGIVSITKQKEGDSKNAVMAAFSGHPSMKRVIIVDRDIDIFNDDEVEWALATRFQADRNMIVVEGARGSTLDPSQDPVSKTTSKLGLDATMPLKDNSRFKPVKG
ncbi:MAG: UbiD family decarboxylase [Thermoplasmatota archaeon]